MKPKEILVFGATGNIGRNLIRKLTKNNYKVVAVTRNIHQKGLKLKTQANPGYLELVELESLNEEKIKYLLKGCSICVNLIVILFEKNRDQELKNYLKHKSSGLNGRIIDLENYLQALQNVVQLISTDYKKLD